MVSGNIEEFFSQASVYDLGLATEPAWSSFFNAIATDTAFYPAIASFDAGEADISQVIDAVPTQFQPQFISLLEAWESIASSDGVSLGRLGDLPSETGSGPASTASPIILSISVTVTETTTVVQDTTTSEPTGTQNPTSAAPTTTGAAPSGGGLSQGTQVGLGVGLGVGLATLIVLAALLFWCFRRGARDEKKRGSAFGISYGDEAAQRSVTA